MSNARLGLQRLRALLEALEAMEEAEFAAFLGGTAAPRPPATPRLPAPAATPDAALAGLDAAASREAGRALLQPLKKPELQALARTLKLPAGSRDTVAALRERIVAATVGARLDAAAIHRG